MVSLKRFKHHQNFHQAFFVAGRGRCIFGEGILKVDFNPVARYADAKLVMKVCDYCGRVNEDAFAQCRECGTRFYQEPEPAKETKSKSGVILEAPILNLDELPGAFGFEEGFSRPDWDVIEKAVEERWDYDNRRLPWEHVALQWTKRLATELGGKYDVVRSESCLLVSDLEPEVDQRLLRSAESAIAKICEALPGIAWNDFVGPHVILVFGEEDDYYQYLSWFYPEGEHPATAGVHISKGYPHIACFYSRETSVAQTIRHELVHDSINHLRVPRWLHEALAMTTERLLGGQRVDILPDDLPERHHRFWNEKLIQKFWAGTSFDEPGESVELSYSLAEVLMPLLTNERKEFLAFIEAVDYDDAGQTAALDCLGRCLGETVGTFLGPGNWRPQRKAIKECWDEKR
jgi:hypothetical protein